MNHRMKNNFKLIITNLRENVSLFPVDRQDDDSDEDDGQTNENGDQEVHVQIQGNHGLDEFGIAT
jgi:hypothetical protein